MLGSQLNSPAAPPANGALASAAEPGSEEASAKAAGDGLPNLKGVNLKGSNLKDGDKKIPVAALTAAQAVPVSTVQLPAAILILPDEVALNEVAKDPPAQIFLPAAEQSNAPTSRPVTIPLNSVASVDGSDEPSRARMYYPPATIAPFSPPSVDEAANLVTNQAPLPFASSPSDRTPSSPLRPAQNTFPQTVVVASPQNPPAPGFLSTQAGVEQTAGVISRDDSLTTSFSDANAPAGVTAPPPPNVSVGADAQNADQTSSVLGVSGAQVFGLNNESAVNVESAIGTISSANTESDSRPALNPSETVAGPTIAAHLSSPTELVQAGAVPAAVSVVSAVEAQSVELKAPAHAASVATARASQKPASRETPDSPTEPDRVAGDVPLRTASVLRENAPSPALTSPASARPPDGVSTSAPLTAAPAAAATTAPQTVDANLPAQTGVGNQVAVSLGVPAQDAPAGKDSQSGKQDADAQSSSAPKISAVSPSQPDAPPTAPAQPAAMVGADNAGPTLANQPGLAAPTPRPSPNATNPDSGRTDSSHSASPNDGPPNLPQTQESPATLSAGPVQMAQMVSKAAQSEMHIGLNTSAFGSVEVHTVVHANDVGVLIGSEKGDLRSMLASELPGIASTLQQQNLRLSQVSFHQGFSFSNQMSSGGGSQPRSFAPRATSSATQPVERMTTETGEATEVSRIGLSAGLNVLA